MVEETKHCRGNNTWNNTSRV